MLAAAAYYAWQSIYSSLDEVELVNFACAPIIGQEVMLLHTIECRNTT